MTSFRITQICRCRDAVKQLLECEKILNLSKDEVSLLQIINVTIQEDLEDIENTTVDARQP